MELETRFEVYTHAKSELIGNSEEKLDLKHGLRENPRKTWRAEDLESPPLVNEQKLMICKQCGKVFKSMKALCGHMACHSEKDRFSKDDRSWTSERFERESFSETDVGGRKRQNRAATKRYEKAKVTGVLDNDSSLVSEIDFEQEEVARCLIMLSRDCRNWAGLGSNQGSLDSVILESKLSSIDVKIGKKRDQVCVDEGVEVKKFRKGKWKSVVFDSKNKEATDVYFETNDFRKQKSRCGSWVKVRSTELGKKIKKYNCRADGLGNESDSKTIKFVSKNNKRKTKQHECPYCSRVFKSGQAMGGHKRTHFLGNSGNRNNPITKVSEAETSEVKDMLDLNLPAPEEEEESEHSQFLNW